MYKLYYISIEDSAVNCFGELLYSKHNLQILFSVLLNSSNYSGFADDWCILILYRNWSHYICKKWPKDFQYQMQPVMVLLRKDIPRQQYHQIWGSILAPIFLWVFFIDDKQFLFLLKRTSCYDSFQIYLNRYNLLLNMFFLFKFINFSNV